MASAKTGLDLWLAARLGAVASFGALSVLAYALTAGQASGAVLQLVLIASSVALVVGIVTTRPDSGFLSWMLLGTVLLVAEDESEASLPLLMGTALTVIWLADFSHSVEMIHPRWAKEVLDDAQDSSRRRLLTRRISTFGVMAAASLAVSYVGVGLAPPLVLPGQAAAVVGIFTVVAVALLVLVTSTGR
jgi:hypothetical protein